MQGMVRQRYSHTGLHVNTSSYTRRQPCLATPQTARQTSFVPFSPTSGSPSIPPSRMTVRVGQSPEPHP